MGCELNDKNIPMGADILILTIYFICVVYVLYQMALSVEAKLEDQVEIVLDTEGVPEAIAAQLAQQRRYQAQAEVVVDKGTSVLKITFATTPGRSGAIALQVTPQGKRPLEPDVTDLSVNLVNTLPDQQVFVNWDSSSLAVLGGVAQRVIRRVPGRPMDLLQPQVMTAVNPGQRVSVSVTGEMLLNRTENQVALDVAKPLLPLATLSTLPETARTYSLQLALWVRSLSRPELPALQLLIPLTFRINILADHVALPILSWLLDVFSGKPKRSR